MKKTERPPTTPARHEIVQRRAQLPRRPPLGPLQRPAGSRNAGRGARRKR
jgi:hypothetical protein